MKEIEKVWEEVRELSLGWSSRSNGIERLESPPSPIRFLREFVSQNKPCIISNAISHWPALSLWPIGGGGGGCGCSYLSRVLSQSLVSLHLTPHGRADSLVQLCHDSSSDHTTSSAVCCFATAHVERVPFPRALDLVLNSSNNSDLNLNGSTATSTATSATDTDRTRMKDTRRNSKKQEEEDQKKWNMAGVAYLQQQNDCFRTEYSELAQDCEAHIPWATEALGCLPEAVNLWIGNHLSQTWFHKDHYENLYAVVSGEKHFLLLPPTDVHRMYIGNYPAAHYVYEKDENGGGEFRLEMEEPARYVPWCSVNPYPSPEDEESERSKYPLYFNGPKPFHCTLKAGDLLYLPSMWFHHVQQTPGAGGCTIAINYWYDMQFDIKYAYFNFLQSIPYGCRLIRTDGEDSSSDAFKWSLGNELHTGASAGATPEANEESESE
uniref:JmjC domain-containing protein n=3 Tax=Rhizophora mucronata TaxID=61149 RepID=A0A2P2JCA7_RHIMU